MFIIASVGLTDTSSIIMYLNVINVSEMLGSGVFCFFPPMISNSFARYSIYHTGSAERCYVISVAVLDTGDLIANRAGEIGQVQWEEHEDE